MRDLCVVTMLCLNNATGSGCATGPRQDNPDAAAAASLIAQSAVLIDDQLAAMSANQRSGDGSDAGIPDGRPFFGMRATKAWVG